MKKLLRCWCYIQSYAIWSYLQVGIGVLYYIKELINHLSSGTLSRLDLGSEKERNHDAATYLFIDNGFGDFGTPEFSIGSQNQKNSKSSGFCSWESKL